MLIEIGSGVPEHVRFMRLISGSVKRFTRIWSRANTSVCAGCGKRLEDFGALYGCCPCDFQFFFHYDEFGEMHIVRTRPFSIVELVKAKIDHLTLYGTGGNPKGIING